MKAPFLAAVALVAVAFAGVAQAGPVSPLYLTGGVPSSIVVVQGNSVIQSFPAVYNGSWERPIAVWGDVRTTGVLSSYRPAGGQYSLGGTPTGTSYVLPGAITGSAYDSTSDGSHNYLVDYSTGWVYQTARDFTNPAALFNTGAYDMGISYDRANNSLWVSGWGNTTVTDYSLSGAPLSSFSTGQIYNGALALDPADHTLWLVDYNSGNLQQYSTAGALLSTGPNVGSAQGGEFNLQPTATPEPGTLTLFGSGVLGLAGVLRRKISL